MTKNKKTSESPHGPYGRSPLDHSGPAPEIDQGGGIYTPHKKKKSRNMWLMVLCLLMFAGAMVFLLAPEKITDAQTKVEELLGG